MFYNNGVVCVTIVMYGWVLDIVGLCMFMYGWVLNILFIDPTVPSKDFYLTLNVLTIVFIVRLSLTAQGNWFQRIFLR